MGVWRQLTIFLLSVFSLMLILSGCMNFSNGHPMSGHHRQMGTKDDGQQIGNSPGRHMTGHGPMNRSSLYVS